MSSGKKCVTTYLSNLGWLKMDGAYVTAEAFVKGIKVGRRQG